VVYAARGHVRFTSSGSACRTPKFTFGVPACLSPYEKTVSPINSPQSRGDDRTLRVDAGDAMRRAMKKPMLIAIRLVGLIAGATLSLESPAASSSQDLYDEVKRLDASLSEAFNSHDVNKLKLLFAEDLEFFQDNEGLAGYEQTVKDFAAMFAQRNNITRELIGNTLEVYPIKDYGAIEVGAHRFCHVENGKNECGTFRFVHIWQKKDGGWKISRAISYAH
jgi:ketosteroid isomerase-like protein